MFVSTFAFEHSTMKIDKLGKHFSSLLSIVPNLAWAWNFFLRFSLFPYQIPATVGGDDFKLGSRNYNCKHGSGDDDEVEECAICLCKIDEDDEIPELRCDHLFHKVCLDRWVGYRRSTCPICRSSLTPRQLVSGMEVVLFKYSSFEDSRHRETWWLR
ncbi:putative E3 ubiquitin-protein ligase XERICO [Hibiscus syriacus]|uniref:E3 ubiquitin-protein ligase XERICO n=1 Tax=Hibiscus syriacus TaxID=106335 RepID=A0A6A3CSN5_HIBSY|nr:putative E3 ubiquitin-protein ligase XERICO [Hibiscus syriacus]